MPTEGGILDGNLTTTITTTTTATTTTNKQKLRDFRFSELQAASTFNGANSRNRSTGSICFALRAPGVARGNLDLVRLQAVRARARGGARKFRFSESPCAGSRAAARKFRFSEAPGNARARGVARGNLDLVRL